jgi:deoxyribose-phosphate aldolase
MLTVEQYAKKFDMAVLAQNTQEAAIREACATARRYNLAALYTTPCWSAIVAAELQGTDVRAGVGIGFPYGTNTSKTKFFEIEETLGMGCTSIDMVINIGALKDKNYTLVKEEIKGLVNRCDRKALAKVIYEVCFLTEEEIAALTQICCEYGVDYLKTATGTAGFPDVTHVKLMKKYLTGGKTKLKLSGVPRTFTLAATLWMLGMGVELIGTRSAAKLVDEYREYLDNKNI